MKAAFLFLALPALTLPSFAHAGVSGRTADGCTYKVINGQYLTDCGKKAEKPAAPANASDTSPAAEAPVAKRVDAALAPSFVSSYGDVPVRSNPDAPMPSVKAAPAIVTVPLTTPSAPALLLSREERQATEADLRYKNRLDDVIEQPYVGALVGATTVSAANKSSAGFGLLVGTLLDDHFGAEFGYNYANQGLNLGLETSGAGLVNQYSRAEDANLKSHLLSLEAQGYLTGALRKFRPFLGLGLGFKSSSLTESPAAAYGPYSYGSNPASLSQTSVGGMGTAGAKMRVGKDVSLAFAFRYYLPFARQEAQLSQNRNAFGDDEADLASANISKSDDGLTGSSQYQISGGLQYAF